MDHRVAQDVSDSPAASTREGVGTETNILATAHPVLSRLIEEVRNERCVEVAYDRVHNRHNRGQ